MIDTEIVNLALARLGDVADVASIAPPDGSMQAQYAAQFYPNARDSALSMHDWGFATSFAQFAPLANTSPRWGYAYALPNDVISIRGTISSYLMDAEYRDTVLEEIAGFGRPAWLEVLNRNGFAVMNGVVYANESDPFFVYTASITDATKFSPLFARFLSWILASDLAGPILKGQAGTTAAKLCADKAMEVLRSAATIDANQQSTRRPYYPAWISGR